MPVKDTLLIIQNWAFRSYYCKVYSLTRDNLFKMYIRIKYIILTTFKKNEIRIGGPDRIVEVGKSQFIEINQPIKRRCRVEIPKKWMFGMFLRPINREASTVLFFQVPNLNRATLLNVINKHILPGTTIYSDQWATCIRTPISEYQHVIVPRPKQLVGANRLHAINVKAAWSQAKHCFDLTFAVCHRNLLSYLDEHSWRLLNGKRGWPVVFNVFRAMKTYFEQNDDIPETDIDEYFVDRKAFEEDEAYSITF
jgi:hypothetical protein